MLQYKVVELSTVDEGSLEETVNAHVLQGWNLDGIQFAMRESSKRPAMAFVFFTREHASEHEHDVAAARERLRRIAGGATGVAPEAAGSERSADPWTRLRELAEGGEEPS